MSIRFVNDEILLNHSFLDPNAILVVLAFITSGIGGSTKKLAFGASFQLGYAVGNICGPQTFKDSEAPHYFVHLTSRRKT